MSRATVLPRVVGVAGAAWGAVLLTRGDDVWRRLEARDPDVIEELGLRLLGGRHLLQGVAQVLAPRLTSGVVVAVDLTHVATMGALAAGSPSRRRAALTTAAVALASAVATARSREQAAS